MGGEEEHEVISGESQRFLRDVTTPSRGHVTHQPPSLLRERREGESVTHRSIQRQASVFGYAMGVAVRKKCDDFESVGHYACVSDCLFVPLPVSLGLFARCVHMNVCIG